MASTSIVLQFSFELKRDAPPVPCVVCTLLPGSCCAQTLRLTRSCGTVCECHPGLQVTPQSPGSTALRSHLAPSHCAPCPAAALCSSAPPLLGAAPPRAELPRACGFLQWGGTAPPPCFLGLRPGAPLVPFKGVAALQQLSPTTLWPSCRLAGRAIGAKEHPHAPQQQPHPMGTQPHGCTRVRVRVPRPPGSQPGLQDTGLWWWVCVWGGGNSSPQGLVYQPPRTQP